MIRPTPHLSAEVADGGSFQLRSFPTSTQTVYVVLPAYNEAIGLEAMLQQLQRLLNYQPFQYRVVVVDDGSSDDTTQVATNASDRMPITVIPHGQNQGLAAAIRTGLGAVVRTCRDDDVIVTMDADNTQPIGLIPAMVGKVNAGYDVLVASRYQSGARILGVPWYRQITSVGVAILFKVLFPIRGIRDYTCGFRGYRGSVLKQAFAKYADDFISETGFSCMVDILLKLSWLQVVMSELPMVLRYDYKDGASKMNVANTIADTLKLAWKRRTGVVG